MKPSQIALIILRLFAVSWFVGGVSSSLSGVATMGRVEFDPLLIIHGVILIIIGAVLWPIGPSLARRMTKEDDTAGPPTVLSLYQLLVTAFVGLGLYFCLSSIGSLIRWVHFLALSHADSHGIAADAPYQSLAADGVTFVAGAFVILTAPQWARKIVKRTMSGIPSKS